MTDKDQSPNDLPPAGENGVPASTLGVEAASTDATTASSEAAATPPTNSSGPAPSENPNGSSSDAQTISLSPQTGNISSEPTPSESESVLEQPAPNVSAEPATSAPPVDTSVQVPAGAPTDETNASFQEVTHRSLAEDIEYAIHCFVDAVENDATLVEKAIGAEVDKLKSLAFNELQALKSKLS